MKIVYIANSFIPSKTANSIHVMQMCQAMALNGHQVSLITFDSPSNEENGIKDVFEYYGIQTCFELIKIKLSTFKGKMHVFALEAVKVAQRIKPDLVYTRCETPAIYLSFTQLPFVIEAHKRYVDKTFFIDKLIVRMLRASNLKRIVTISKALQNLFIEDFNIDKNKMLVLHDAATPVNNLKENVSNWHARDGALQVGYFGHLYKGRGVEMILQMAQALPQVDFHIVGGRAEDVNYWQEQMHNVNNISFYGFISPALVASYRHKCDVLLAPYQRAVWVANNGHESSKYMSPLKIFEYMASQKCIICSDMPVLREVLSEKNALLVEPDDVKLWISALTLCQDSTLRQQLGNAAFDDFSKHYTWEKRALRALEKL
ncbi:glycosyltransferase family 4 protein [Carboxylicivirga sp. M1479]|uniref:glycosyltransferase family 4 protein n=1 Tax=Carboxylicivirga sp. M1479 TaxID=2594476 RepID=UPI001178C610|nr:glycosyltransferase family 4 protein [Carboxylicivirga sp. M1479]TRX66353.1 glycosyltransferase family 4 protein [Carboxylicivirga sp. M1479]